MLFGKFQSSVREGVPLAPYTWLQLGGPAKYFAEPSDPCFGWWFEYLGA
jgi:hypothetical protein